MRRVIVDTGPLVAFCNPRDAHHAWALEQSRDLAAPLLTCEAVLTETYHLLGRVPRARAASRTWIGQGRVKTPFHFEDEASSVLNVLEKYADRPMDVADACLVRMVEQLGLPVFTADVADLSIYRVHHDQPLDLIAPAYPGRSQ